MTFALLLPAGAVLSAPAAGSMSIKTNFVERWFTNVIEVRIPVDRIVTEYRTNVVQRVTTNLVSLYATNVVARTVTNHLPVTLTRTNFVQSYQTNYKTLNLTNWSTVLVLKTNWVSRTITNVVEVDMQKNSVEQVQPARDPDPATASAASPQLEPLIIEARRGSRAGGVGNVPVEMWARWRTPAGAAAEVQQWRVESETGAFLSFGQEPEFSRALPPGRYKVQVKMRPRDSGSPLTFKATLFVSTDAVRVEQNALARR